MMIRRKHDKTETSVKTFANGSPWLDQHKAMILTPLFEIKQVFTSVSVKPFAKKKMGLKKTTICLKI